MSFRALTCLVFVSACLVHAPAHADETPASPAPLAPPAPASSLPRVGGHVGTAFPLFTLAKDSTFVGKDFVTLGLTPGITVHLDDRWAIDFEFIALNQLKNTPAPTTFVVDPGVLYKADSFVVGLRVATQVGAPTNLGLVPILVVPVKISERLSYFAEIDAPLFLRDNGQSVQPSATLLFQTGVGF